jgi:predicted nucleic acid-binding protein
VLLKLLVEEPLSAKVQAFVERGRRPVPVNWLVELEVRNALRAKRFRVEMGDEQLAACLDLFERLLEEGKLAYLPLRAEAVVAATLELVPELTPATGCRTLDLMHVAAARLLSCRRFISTDQRQLRAACAAGLETVDLEAAAV